MKLNKKQTLKKFRIEKISFDRDIFKNNIVTT